MFCVSPVDVYKREKKEKKWTKKTATCTREEQRILHWHRRQLWDFISKRKLLVLIKRKARLLLLLHTF